MLVDHQWFTPPSVVMAALIQKNDRLRSIADSPANQQLCSRISPNKCFSRYDLSLLNQAHINVFIEKANRDVVLWGSYTSSKSHGHETALPVARTIGSIRDAVARTVEPYLMEPRTPKSCSDIEFSLNKLFSKLHQKRIFSQTKEPFQIECFYRNQARFSDASIDIDIRFVIDRAESYLGLNCGY
jgi:hypothetical protein